MKLIPTDEQKEARGTSETSRATGNRFAQAKRKSRFLINRFNVRNNEDGTETVTVWGRDDQMIGKPYVRHRTTTWDERNVHYDHETGGRKFTATRKDGSALYWTHNPTQGAWYWMIDPDGTIKKWTRPLGGPPFVTP